MPSSPPQPDPRTDLQLVADANAGDESAFEALYYRYRDWVVRFAHRVTGDRDAALDVMQETFTYLLRKFPGFELTAKMTTFLYPVVKHLAVAARKKSARYVSPDDRAPDPSAPADTDPAVAGEDPRAALAHVLAGLSENHREIVLLRFVDGLALQEIAEAVEAPLGTVKSRLHHALAALRDDPATKKYFEP